MSELLTPFSPGNAANLIHDACDFLRRVAHIDARYATEYISRIAVRGIVVDDRVIPELRMERLFTGYSRLTARQGAPSRQEFDSGVFLHRINRSDRMDRIDPSYMAPTTPQVEAFADFMTDGVKAPLVAAFGTYNRLDPAQDENLVVAHAATPADQTREALMFSLLGGSGDPQSGNLTATRNFIHPDFKRFGQTVCVQYHFNSGMTPEAASELYGPKIDGFFGIDNYLTQVV